jgi:hypothetical protein
MRRGAHLRNHASQAAVADSKLAVSPRNAGRASSETVLPHASSLIQAGAGLGGSSDGSGTWRAAVRRREA